MSDRVSIEISDGVADVRLTRGDKMNALDLATFAAINDTIASLETTKGLRAVVLSGEGRAFCAGIDTDVLGTNSTGGDLMQRTHGLANSFQGVAWGWRTLPVPVIAAVHGYAFGGGFQLMLGADIRIAAPETLFSIMEMHWGLVPDMAGIALLKGLLRDDAVRELTYTARKFDAAEAVSLGVVTRIADDAHAAALALAHQIAGQSPEAVRAAKRLFNLAPDADAPAILLAEAREQAALVNSAGHAEAVAAGRARRRPIFQDL